MKKRFLTLLLTAALSLSLLAVPAGATQSGRFSDVTDQTTTTAAEVLRLMGVISGFEDGTFRPSERLTRAQFCKMAIFATDTSSELGRYRTVTIFPDVKASYWAADSINLAAKGKGIIAGFPDGKFYPDRPVTVGQATTILLRLLGYTDEEVGGVWPDSYMAVGAEIGLTDGISSNGNADLTRAQAARLFLNLLEAKKNGGGTLYTFSEETRLLSVDGSAGDMKTSDKTYKMVSPVSSTSMVGMSGRVVLNSSGKALTFLPATGSSGSLANTAVIINANKSTVGLADLAGTDSYALYKNGLPINANDLRKYDVAIYSPDTNSIRVSDTRVAVYYESCDPSPAAPTTITVLGGTTFSVLPSAASSLSQFRPGARMTLLLTADGQVAAAIESDNGLARSNAVGIVSHDGTVDLLCGTKRIPLAVTAEAEYYGRAVRVSASTNNGVHLSAINSSIPGDLNVVEKTLGSKRLAENAMIFDNGEQISLSQINSGTVKAENISAYRTNWAGDVDLISLGGGQSGDVIYGRAIVKTTYPEEGDEYGRPTTTVEIVSAGKSTGAIQTTLGAENGAYVAATMRNGKLTMISTLTRLKNVSPSSWIGTSSVLHGGRSYVISSNVQCYNLDSQSWVTLEQALAYGNSANLYVQDGVVHIIEVTYK